jgi:hypothetical protein
MAGNEHPQRRPFRDIRIPPLPTALLKLKIWP